MTEYLTPNMLDKIIKYADDGKSGLEEYKSRSKKYVVPEENVKEYITLSYSIWICRYLKGKMKRGGYLNLQDTISALENTNWTFHSYNHLVYCSHAELSRMLLKTKPKYKDNGNRATLLEMLEEQAQYLNRATTWLLGELEGIIDREEKGK